MVYIVKGLLGGSCFDCLGYASGFSFIVIQDKFIYENSQQHG
jgi:hypothetical protein